MNKFETFATAITCIDGRVQVPVSDWIKLHSQVRYVDMITEPGVDGIFSSNNDRLIYAIYEKLKLSIKVHQPKTISFVGHYDCQGNPVSFEEHEDQINYGVEMIKSWNLGIRILGLYVNEWNSVDLINDTDRDFKEMKNYL